MNGSIAAERTERSKTDGFTQWIAKPEVKMLISILPPLETEVQKECFNAILRSFFNAGHDSGSALVAMLLIEGVMMRASDKDHR